MNNLHNTFWMQRYGEGLSGLRDVLALLISGFILAIMAVAITILALMAWKDF